MGILQYRVSDLCVFDLFYVYIFIVFVLVPVHCMSIVQFDTIGLDYQFNLSKGKCCTRGKPASSPYREISSIIALQRKCMLKVCRTPGPTACSKTKMLDNVCLKI